MTTFPDGTHILLGAVPPIELHQLSNVFLPVDGMEHLDHLWRGYRRVKGPKYRPPGVDTHITAEFVDPNVEDHTYNLSDDTYMAVVVSDTDGPITFAPGIRILAGAVNVAELFKFNTNVFLPVGETDYRGYTWERICLTKTFHFQGNDVTVDFATPGVPSKTYPADGLTNLMMAVWETGQVIAGLVQGQS
jgi:hypothetical protein